VTAGQAETYLRLRAEAELRRALTLPRIDPPDEDGMPGPLRAVVEIARPGAVLVANAARPALPLARRAAGALQPLRDEAARALQPLSDAAARRLRPRAEEAARRAQQLAEGAARRLQPRAEQVVRTAAPLGWRAAGALQTLGAETMDSILGLRRQAARAVSFLPGDRPGIAERREMSADEGVQRLRTVASALVQAGAIDNATADSVLDGLETALLARSRISPHWLWRRDMLAGRGRPPAAAPAGRYLAVPVGVTMAAAPDSGLGDTSLLTLVIAPDLASLTATGRQREPLGQVPRRDRWAALHGSRGSWPSATDDHGNSYQLDLGSWSSENDGGWTGSLDISPVPAAGISWLDLNVSPGSAAIRVDITGASRESDAAAGLPPAGGPVDRLFETAAERLLEYAARHHDGIRHYQGLAGIADIAAALEACGVLPPACAALDRLTALARHLGVDVPAALSSSAQPAELPGAWTSVLENAHRRDGPRAVAAAGAVLPELGGARFVLAGLQSGAEAAELRILGWGQQLDPYSLGREPDGPWSWWARDDAGRWHILRMDGGGYGDGHSDAAMRLFPPLHPETTALEVTLTGSAGSATVTMPLNWLARA
jgi:hypothetical protein